MQLMKHKYIVMDKYDLERYNKNKKIKFRPLKSDFYRNTRKLSNSNTQKNLGSENENSCKSFESSSSFNFSHGHFP